MQYIHQQTEWPDLYWDDEQLAPALANVRQKMAFLLGRLSTLGFTIKSEATLEVLSTEILKSSAIEGELLDPEQVRSSLARRLGVDIGGLRPASRDVEGIVEVILDATTHYQQELSEERLGKWHSALFPTGMSGLHKITVGAWRLPSAGPMQVVSGPMGRECVHFEAPAAERLAEEMNTFLDWFNYAEGIDPIVRAGAAHFWFVTIHPFEDGNGRIVRAITDMCLAQADDMPERFYSMSVAIERERKAYYQILEDCQKGGLDISAWLEWFLACLNSALDSAEDTLQRVLHKAKIWQHLSKYSINGRQRKIINRLLAHFEGKLTTSKYAKLAKCSQDTALRDIQALIEYGVMQKEAAGGRSTSYVLVGSDRL